MSEPMYSPPPPPPIAPPPAGPGAAQQVQGPALGLIPCFCPSCFVGIPVGIWSLVVLMKPEVKAAFTK
jgi:hypothetical protein